MKKINLIIIGFGLSLTVNYGIGYIFLIPVLLYYLKKDLNNSFYLLPSITISTLLCNFNKTINVLIIEILLILVTLLFQRVVKNKKIKTILYILTIIITNLISFLIQSIDIFNIMNLLFILVSLLIFLFICFETKINKKC